jgi:hypothetical protein
MSMDLHLGRRIVVSIALATLVSACGGAPSAPASAPEPAPPSLDTPEIAAALKGFQGSAIRQHMTVATNRRCNTWRRR